MKSRPNQSRSAGRRRERPDRARRESRWKTWLAEKAPILRFCGIFFGLLVLLEFLSYLPACQRAEGASTIYYARLASFILNRVGEATHCAGPTISSSRWSLTVLPTCTAFELPMFFSALVIGFPSRIAPKIVGILAGTVALLSLNLLRVASLFVIGVHFPRIFEMAHERLWATIFVSGVVAISFLWIKWAAQPYPNDAAA